MIILFLSFMERDYECRVGFVNTGLNSGCFAFVCWQLFVLYNHLNSGKFSFVLALLLLFLFVVLLYLS